MKSFGTIAETITPLATKLGTLSEELTQIVRSVDQKKVTEHRRQCRQVHRRHLGGSSDDVGKAIKDVASITDKLNKAADQVEGVLKARRPSSIRLPGEDGRSTFTEISDAAKSIRVLADNLDKRTAEITTGISRFTGPGLRDIETLATRRPQDPERSQPHPAQFRAQSRSNSSSAASRRFPQYGGSR
jgi:phospholipid/cholesterol/gamma-HCH transport system substrate-binding protein